MTLRRLVGKYICLTQRRLMIRGLPQIIRDYQEPLEAGISLTMGSTWVIRIREMKRQLGRIWPGTRRLRQWMAVIVSRVLIDRLEPVFQGALSPGRGALIWRTVFPKRLLWWMRQELKMLMSMGKNIAQQTVMEWWYTTEWHLIGKITWCWMCRKAIAKQNYVATGKLPPLIAARLYWLILIPISASPGLLKR